MKCPFIKSKKLFWFTVPATLTTTLITILLGKQPQALASHCKWWQIFCNEPIPAGPLYETFVTRIDYTEDIVTGQPRGSLNFTAKISDDFSANQRNIIKSAIQNTLAPRIIFDPEIFFCTLEAKTNFKSTEPNREAAVLRDELIKALRSGPTLYINKFDKPISDSFVTRGQAEIDYFYRNNKFSIELNSLALGNGSSYPRANEQAIWAGTIAHEMLHNIGWRHPVGVYDGTVIRTFQNCLVSNGSDATGGSFSLVGEPEIEE